jgi:glucose-1-phosphate cytidylyltransferase
MKVVILAGGLGTRLSEETNLKPKPMVEIGGKPVLWHIMKIYASYGHTDFVICAGYKGDQIKQYFYSYAASNMDFTVKLGHQDSAVFHGSHEEFGWTVTVADTGLETPTGGRLHKVERYLDGNRFLCTYGDGLASVNVDDFVQDHVKSEAVATMTVTKPRTRFGVVEVDENRQVLGFKEKPETSDFVNIGYFVFEHEIFRYLNAGSILEEAPLQSVVADARAAAHIHRGFWQPMDTLREKRILDEMASSGTAPWLLG